MPNSYDEEEELIEGYYIIPDTLEIYERMIALDLLKKVTKRSELWNLLASSNENEGVEYSEGHYISYIFSPGYKKEEHISFLWLLNKLPIEKAHDLLALLEAGEMSDGFTEISLPSRKKDVKWRKRNLYKIINADTYFDDVTCNEIDLVNELYIELINNKWIISRIVKDEVVYTTTINKKEKLYPYGNS